MAESDDAGPGQGLVWTDSLPLRWCRADPDALAAEALRHHDNNEEVLRFIDALEEYPVETGEERQPAAQEMLRLETKLNLLLGLMGQLLAVHFPLPPSRPLRLNPSGIEWTAETGPDAGETGTIEIYLNGRCPRALIFAGQVEKVEAGAEGHRYTVRFTALGEPVRDRLEKIIFRHHRRSVALARRRTPPA
jgi:hypothetical protein